MRMFVGSLIVGVILYVVPGNRSGPACVAAGALLTWLLELCAPRSIAEKVGLALIVGLIAWVAGPRAAFSQSFLAHLLGWAAAAGALAFYLHPKAE
jgi:hypothetical protein